MLSNPLPTVSALPLENDLTEWHCNICPDSGPYAGNAIHLVLRFPARYPLDPPALELCTLLPHPNVFNHNFVCLDMLRGQSDYGYDFDFDYHQFAPKPYVGGWSSAYSVQSILLQLQVFLTSVHIVSPSGVWGVRPHHPIQ